MNSIWEGIAVLIAVVAALAGGWWWFGRLVTPLPKRSVHTVVTGVGDGEELEQIIHGLLWIRSCGCGAGAIVIVNTGLSEEGLLLAQRIASEKEAVVLCQPEELGDMLRNAYIEGA